MEARYYLQSSKLSLLRLGHLLFLLVKHIMFRTDISLGNLPRHGDNVPNGRSFVEHPVNELEIAVHRLRVERQDCHWNTGASANKHNIILPSNSRYGHRRDHRDDKVPQPMVGRRDRRHGHAKTDWGDFSAVEKVPTQKPDRIEEVEQENSNGRYDRCCVVGGWEAGCHCHHEHA